MRAVVSKLLRHSSWEGNEAVATKEIPNIWS